MNERKSYGFIDRESDDTIYPYIQETFSGKVVAVPLPDIARDLYRTCNNLIKVPDQYVAVGSSADDMVRYWPPGVGIVAQSVSTIASSRDRRRRIVQAEDLIELKGVRCFVDDVAVTGNTLSEAMRKAPCAESLVAAGVTWDSKVLRRAMGNTVLISCVRVSQEGGGIPPVNTLSTLLDKPDICAEYSYRKFGDMTALDETKDIYRRGGVI